ncbi:MAG: hydroxyacid dehydrogenase [Clostridiales bacterium]|nr:hydroxyacid dehydrogenase [Clostridiales bacterium]
MKILHIGKAENMERYTPDVPAAKTAMVAEMPMGHTAQEYAAAMPDAEVIVADAIAEVPGVLMEKLPQLKMIHSEGVAFNRIDVAAASVRGISVCNCAGMNASAVAEQTILLMEGMLKNVIVNDRAVREGWQITVKENYMAQGSLKELSDCRVGLVGFGDIGKCTARLLAAYGAEVYYYKRHRLAPEEELAANAMYLPLDELLELCDIVSLHLPVTEETTGMCDRTFFEKMRPGSYFVNTSRGELVDDEALAEALAGGRLTMAGLDTLDQEPVQKDHPLLRQPREVLDRILFTPHIGGITASSFRRGYAMIWDNIGRLEEGRPLLRVIRG